MQNPYTNRRSVRDPSMFFGRTHDLARIYALLANTQCISITGHRRIGKSSLLYCLALPAVQVRIGKYNFSNYIFVYNDLQGGIYKNSNEFLYNLLSKLQKQLEDREIFQRGKAKGHNTFEEVVAQVNSQGFKLVFLLDEFDYITKNEYFDAPFFSFMRYMANNYDLSLVTVSQRHLADLCHQGIADSPFFNIFASIRLEDLEEVEARDLISEPSLQVGYPLASEVDWVMQMAGHHPFFIQIICFHLLDNLQRGKAADYERVGQFFYQEVQDHFKYAWQHLTKEELQLVNREIWQNEGPYQHHLTKSHVFRRFARMRNESVEPRLELITEETVKEAFKNIWNTSFLGQCPLADLNIVKASRSVSSIGSDLGKVLHKVLIEAIGHLRVTDKENKMDKKWRHWFILQQHYLEGLPNTDIIARLNIAERTFYREQSEALAAAVIILQNMEIGASSK